MHKKLTFIANDGKEFDRPEACLNYEILLEFTNEVWNATGITIDSAQLTCEYILSRYDLVRRNDLTVSVEKSKDIRF